MTTTTKTLLMGFLVPLALAGCPGEDPPAEGGTETETAGDGDGDMGDGDGDGDLGDGDGDGDGDQGDGDGDGDGDPPDPIVYPDNPPEDYARVDRMGMPAIATAVISGMNKDAYNAANPPDDVALDFAPDIIASIAGLHDALDDDLMMASLIDCDNDVCLAQAQPHVIPDTLKINLEAPAGFPNGRGLTDQVIDVTLALILLDLGPMGMGQTPASLVGTNPTENDVDFLADFPYLAPPN
jgi:hypothetical protein